MLLLVGLGNPEPRYAYNRHNIGFMALDDIVQRHGFGPWRRRFSGKVAEGQLAGDKALALKPMTFMNESGRSVGEAVRFLKLDLGRVFVIHDELDLAPGKCRVKKGGGAGGHNGLRSLDRHLGPDYWRVRLGIGHPGVKHLVNPHVLSDFDEEEEAWLDPLLEAVAKAAPLLAEGQPEKFMTKVALLTQPPPPPPGKAAAAPP